MRANFALTIVPQPDIWYQSVEKKHLPVSHFGARLGLGALVERMGDSPNSNFVWAYFPDDALSTIDLIKLNGKSPNVRV